MVLNDEMEFYQKYTWALNPFLSFKEILQRIRELLDEKIESNPEWCKREWLINIYMLCSAAVDVADDYLGKGVYNFSRVTDNLPFMSAPCRLMEKGLMLASQLVARLKDGGVRSWRKRLADLLLDVCERLIDERSPGVGDQERFRETFTHLSQYPFPKSLERARAKIPAAYRSQDLSHYDFLSLGEKYAANHSECKDQPHVVIGLRTAGSYIAPLVSACLRRNGYRKAVFITMRPKGVLTPWDKAQFLNAIQQDSRYILVDEPAWTGKTLSYCIELLKYFGIKEDAITIAVPVHPAGRKWLDASLKQSLGKAEVITHEPEEWYKVRLLRLEEFSHSVGPYFCKLGFKEIRGEETGEAQKINERLSSNPKNEYHVRLKKVIQIDAEDPDGAKKNFIVMAKSTGWGWLGYHAALVAKKVSDYIPEFYGLRNGIMYLSWVESIERTQKETGDRDEISETLAAYISQRTNELRLKEDPTLSGGGYRDSGLHAVALILSDAFGPKVSKLKRGWIRELLKRRNCPVPALLDGRMMKHEWINPGDGLFLKSDFEHHGFSKTASHNIVDPAYDLARAMLEFNLSSDEKERLVVSYARRTGDASVVDRLIYYKILVGEETKQQALDGMNRQELYFAYRKMNLQYIKAWNFLVSEHMSHAASICRGEKRRSWAPPWFVMDIDEVLDKNIFGFPGTTARGITAISLLRSHGICSVINTARSFDEVREYCQNYGFSGGIGEYGSFIWDDIEGKATILISKEAEEELVTMQKALEEIPGIFTNPFYHYSIRAFSYNRERTTPVPEAVIGELFSKLGVKHLKTYRTGIDTAICDKAVDKGIALVCLKEMKGGADFKIGAIGDTESDFPMMIVASHGFLVSNSTPELKRKASNFGVRLLSSSFQSGLLQGVMGFLHEDGEKQCEKCTTIYRALESNSEPIWKIWKIADMSTIQHWMRSFDRHCFEIFKD